MEFTIRALHKPMCASMHCRRPATYEVDAIPLCGECGMVAVSEVLGGNPHRMHVRRIEPVTCLRCRTAEAVAVVGLCEHCQRCIGAGVGEKPGICAS